VEAVIAHYHSPVRDFSWCIEQIGKGEIDAAYVVGGYPDSWLDSNAVSKLGSLKLLVVQDILRSPLTDTADFLLASASFAEREGTVINHNGLAQLQHAAIRTPGDVWSDGRILMNLSDRKGLFHSQTIRAEIAKHIPKLSAWGDGIIGEEGTKVLL
jgi:NADH-quinone oxidoreductase subunit G